LQQNGCPSLNTDMFNIFATMCLLVNGVVECSTYNDNREGVFQELKACEERAEYRFYETVGGFINNDYPFKSITVGCRSDEDDS